jgi:hypothetical protein
LCDKTPRSRSEKGSIKRVKTDVTTERMKEEKELREKRKQMIYLLEEKRKHKPIKINPEMSHQF